MLLDGKMPVLSGMVATQYLRSLRRGIKVIATFDSGMSSQMLGLGAVAAPGE